MTKVLYAAVILSFFILPVGLPAQGLTLEYSTYLGGTSYDYGYGIAVDSAYCAYITGDTISYNFPSLNPYQENISGLYDCFITKLDSSGSLLVYSTTLGGIDDDRAKSIALDPDRNVYITGYTDSSDYPTLNAYQASFAEGTYDAIISILSASGSSLLYSTYLGGNSEDQGSGIAADADGYIYCSGWTDSVDFPTTMLGLQKQYGGGQYDAFFTKLSRGGTTLKYSTYLGGSDADKAYGIALDSSGWAYVSGETSSIDFPTFNPYQSYLNLSQDLFVTRFLAGGDSYSTFLGGGGPEYQGTVAVDNDGCAYVTGYTGSIDFPTINPFQAGRAESYDICYAKLSSSGSSLIYSSYLGGDDYDYPYAIALDAENRVALVGITRSDDFPTRNPYQPSKPAAGTASGFALKLGASGSSLLYSTYLGGITSDYINGVAVGAGGNEYLAGYTYSSDFPTVNPYQSMNQGGSDIIIVKLFYQPTPIPTPSPPPTSSPTLTPVSTSTPGPTVPPTPTATPTPEEVDPPWISDYDGDGTSNIAIFRESSGLWAIRNLTRVYFGTVEDIPIPNDYSGDGTTEITVFRASSGLWAIRSLSRIYFGAAGDTPVPGDYDGDRTAEVGIFRPDSGLWAIRDVTRIYFGAGTDEPVEGYYEGDSASVAIFRPATGLWAIREVTRIYFGGSDDQIVPGNYTGNGEWRPGIFRAPTGLWALVDATRVYFGGASDTPVQADYDGAGTDGIGVFRSSSGLWAIRGLTRIYFGGSGDLPVTR